MQEKSFGSEFQQTVGHAMRTILPMGTQPSGILKKLSKVFKKKGRASNHEIWKWRSPPTLPSDVFAAAAYLCKIGGVVPFFEPSPYEGDKSSGRFALSVDERGALTAAANEWRKPDSETVLPELVFEQWEILVQSWSLTVTPGIHVANGDGAPAWWRAALKLVILSDLACDGMFDGEWEQREETQLTAMEEWLDELYSALRNSDDFRPPASIGMLADSSLVCVLPKVRVAAVGATLRNLTRNLSLLPGRGEVRCYWETPMQAMPSENSSTLDILLIPEPRKLDAGDFEPCLDENRTEGQRHEEKTDWEYFELRQRWIEGSALRYRFVRDCSDLLRNAQKQSRTINGIVLPEYALDFPLFDHLCSQLKKIEPELEFVISGASDNCYDEPGNHVLTRVWYQGEDESLTQSRAKHHRWRMNRSQIETYALGSALNPKINNWWESSPLGRRELHFQRFRKASVLSVLICEELARSDPCHEILRAVAPNLIFALLLDGPQIRTRWPAQYAANLADDPGSAVLTFTSFGLIDRCNKQGHYPENGSIALWKDDSGNLVEIGMPKGNGMRGVLLSLWSEHVVDQTLMGSRRSVRAWRYSGHYPIQLADDP